MEFWSMFYQKLKFHMFRAKSDLARLACVIIYHIWHKMVSISYLVIVPALRWVHWGDWPGVIGKVAQACSHSDGHRIPRSCKRGYTSTHKHFLILDLRHICYYPTIQASIWPNLQLISEETIQGHGYRKTQANKGPLKTAVCTSPQCVFLCLIVSLFSNSSNCETSIFDPLLSTPWTFLPQS